MFKKIIMLSIIILLSSLAYANKTNVSSEYVPGEIIIKFKQDPLIRENSEFMALVLGKAKIETRFSSINKINKKYNIDKSVRIFTFIFAGN